MNLKIYYFMNLKINGLEKVEFSLYSCMKQFRDNCILRCHLEREIDHFIVFSPFFIFSLFKINQFALKASCFNRIKPGPEVIKLFSCSAQLSMKF